MARLSRSRGDSDLIMCLRVRRSSMAEEVDVVVISKIWKLRERGDDLLDIPLKSGLRFQHCGESLSRVKLERRWPGAISSSQLGA